MNKQIQVTEPKGIKGFIETSFLDWDGLLSSVIFLPYCNFHCPFCHNWQVVEEPETIEDVEWEVIKKYLIGKKGWIDGIVITGGEPTIYPQLELLLRAIKSLGYKIKLDTNGYNPSSLEELCRKELLDYIAMDIKAPLDERYEVASGVKGLELNMLRESISFLLEGKIDYEFRTTLVPSLITAEEIKEIGEAISGAKKWVLQDYQPQAAREKAFRFVQPYSKEEVESFLSLAKRYAQEVYYRGKWR